MRFNCGDILYLYAEGNKYWYKVMHEEYAYGHWKVCVMDEDGDYALITKATIVNRMKIPVNGQYWEHHPAKYLPEEIFTL